MKRDMDFIRRILVDTAESDTFISAQSFSDSEHSETEAIYHVSILRDAGLLDADIEPYRSGGYHAIVKGLTWAGQDFMESIASDNVWNSTRKTIKDAVGSASLSVIKATSEGVATALISKSLGH